MKKQKVNEVRWSFNLAEAMEERLTEMAEQYETSRGGVIRMIALKAMKGDPMVPFKFKKRYGKKDIRVNVSMTKKIDDWLQARAEEIGGSKAGILRRLIKIELED